MGRYIKPWEHVEEFYPHCGMGVRVWIWKDLIKEVRVQTGCEE